MKIKPQHFAVTALTLCIATLAAVSTAQMAPQGKGFSTAHSSAFAGPLQTEHRFDRLIVRFKDGAVTRAGVFDFNAARSQVALLQAGTAPKLPGPPAASLAYLKSITAETHVVISGQKLNRAELFAFAKQLEQDPRVVYAEIDEIAQPLFTPNDPAYPGQQWHYQSPAVFPGGLNLPGAWDRSTGKGVVVAVIDTGVRPHVDLAANLLPGYDFVSDLAMANDGDGRDGNASDPGTWNLAGACGTGSPATRSTWHGTHVAGTIAAVTNNGTGGAGVAFGAKVLPVRVLGVCGGFGSDIAAGMRWAAGLSVPGVPDNPNKAKVLNLSLGSSGTCGQTFQDAVNALKNVGSVVVAATGNDGQIGIGQPANCAGVIAVTAHTKLGDNADYANIGAGTTLSGPGGGYGSNIAGDGAGIYSTLNTGATSPGADSYASSQGTSMAAPHVAGLAALLASVQPAITPDALRSVLISSARPHPAGTFCEKRSDCGAGLADAKAALDRLDSLAPSVAASVAQAGVQRTGATVTFNAAASAGSSGSAISSYEWSQLTGPAVRLSSTTAASTSFVAPAPGASYTFQVKVTDGLGLTAANQVSVTSNTAPVLNPIAAQTVLHGSNLSFTASATDAENNSVVFVANNLPAGSSLNPASGVFTWNAAGPAANYSFTITPSDGTFSGAPQTVSVAVTAPPPVSGGGGGSMDWLDVLALLSLATLSVYFGRRHGTPR
ncbi:S8 family peptidase [Polaromonas hydrogenivorans]|uniref:S8 family serine peptidase n=1 Tax=Polaromonas hydrogenivorans TaxID=335476 RepID=A0AAU7LVW4_9BURK